MNWRSVTAGCVRRAAGTLREKLYNPDCAGKYWARSWGSFWHHAEIWDMLASFEMCLSDNTISGNETLIGGAKCFEQAEA